MKNLYIFLIGLLILNIPMQNAQSQVCSSGTPIFYVDLSGQPSGVWQSPPILRGGDCCGTDVNCIEFIVTLDSMATGILFNIVAGAMPGGALYYQVNCGPLTSIGTPVCLTGPGPHDITFCKPGNNLNTYEIASIPIPDVTGTEWVSQACIGNMSIQGLDPATTTWTSIPPNPLHNSYLSCTAGCNNVTVTPTGVFPAYVDYQVCGYPVGGCYTTPFCDTMRVNFVSSLVVAITPQNPVICFGAPPATVTANPGGGIAPFNYIWSTGATTQSINVTAGTYYVSITDSMNCSVAYDSVVVSAMASTIAANAGPNQILCLNTPSALLNGSVTAATGGIWIGGNGSFNPNNTTLNATYSPSPAEISNGSVLLSLITTGNNTCPADTDQVVISLSPNPAPQIQGTTTVCEFSVATYTTAFISGHNYFWNITGGTILSYNAYSVTVQWGANGNGIISVTESNSLQCDSTVTVNIVIAAQPVPVISGPTTTCTTTNTSFSITSIVPGNNYSWNITGGTITGPTNGSTVNVLWSAPGTATLTVTESNSSGCDSTVSISITVLTIPAPVLSGTDTICEMQTAVYSVPFVAGNTYSWNITGGTILNTNNNSITVQWPATGNGTVSLTQSNTLVCDSTVSIAIVVAPQPAPVINGPATNCTTTSTTFNIVSPVPGNTYAWTVSGGIISGPSNGTSINVNWSSPGTATISVNETNALGCDSSVQITATVLTMPAPVIAGPDTICEMQTVTYSTPFVPGNTYAWNITGGTIINTNNNAVTVQWPATGNGTVSVTQSNTISCDSTMSTAIIVAPQPAPVINGPAINCTTTNSQYTVNTPVPGNTYAWTVNGGTITGPSNGTSINVFWSAPGTASITLTQSNSLGCDSMVQTTATVLTMPAPLIAGPDTICEMQTVTYSTPFVAGHAYSWNVTGGSILNTNNNTITVLWPATGNGAVSVTQSNTLSCDSTVSTVIIVAPQPAPVINGPAINCTTTNTQYTVSTPVPGNTYAWTVSGGTIIGPSNGTSINVFWSSPGTASISLTESNSLGCDSLVQVAASVMTIPTPVIAGPDTICEMQTVTYSTPLVAGNTYTWNVTGGTVTTNNNNTITVLWPGNGSGSVSVTESNGTTCDSTVTTSILVAPQPAPVINGAQTTCTTTSNTFNVITPVPGNTYAWTVTGGTIIGPSNGTSINVQWTNPGTATISLNESNSLGCDSTVSVSPTVLTIPAPVISGPDTVCALHTISYSTPLVAGNTYNWVVNGGNIVSNNNNSIVVDWPANGTGSVTVTESNSATCVASATTNIFIAPQPVPVINGSLSACTATYAQFTVSNTTPGNTYNWSITGAQIIGPANGTVLNILWTNAGSAVLSFTESNYLGCDSTVSVTINVLQRPEPEITGPPVICEETQATYTVSTVNPTHTYFWSVVNGTIIGLSVGSSVDVLWSNAGPGSVTLRQVSPNGCDSTTMNNVMVNPLPAPAIVGPALNCENESGTYSTIPTVGNTYLWSTTGGVINGNTNISQITVSWISGPIANVYLTETTPNGCISFAQLPIQIRSKPEPQIQGNTLGCIDNLQNNYFTLPEPGINYQWSVTGGTISSGNGTANIMVQWQNAGIQTMTLTATNSLTGCDSSVTFQVQTGALPQPVIQGPSLSGCIPISMNFTGNILSPSFNYQWNFGDGTYMQGPNPSHEYDQPGTYTIQLIATNNTNCADTVTALVNAYPVPQSEFDLNHGTDTYYANLSTMTLDNLSTGATIYEWNFGNGVSSADFEPNYQYTEPGNYTISLLVTNQYGCTDINSTKLEVKLPENIYVPNAFTPNGDNRNDHFNIAAYNIADFSINIFNRWGKLIYASTDPYFQWDGRYNGSEAVNGVYVYDLKARGIYGTDFNLTGTVTVVK